MRSKAFFRFLISFSCLIANRKLVSLLIDSEPSSTVTPQRTPYSDDLPNELVHSVVFGDTIIGIALQYESTVDAIIEYNGIGANGLIFVNQTLLVPVPSDRGTPVIPLVTSTPLPSTTGGNNGQGGVGVPVNGVHIVQNGDNLFRIALRYNRGTTVGKPAIPYIFHF